MAIIGGSVDPLTGRPRLPVFGGASGSAPVQPADVLLDFVNGVYRVDGVSYPSAAAAGFPGTGTFSGAGYFATNSTDGLSGTVALPGDFMVFSEFVSPANDGSTHILWSHNGPGTAQVSKTNAGFSTNPSTQTGAATKISMGRSGGFAKSSFNNASVVTGSALGVQGSASFDIGNTAAMFPFISAIRVIAIYKQTLTDAQIQTLGVL